MYGSEQAWAQNLFQSLPHVGPVRSYSSPLAKLTRAATAAAAATELQPIQVLLPPTQADPFQRRMSKSEIGGKDASRKNSITESEAFPEITQSRAHTPKSAPTVSGLSFTGKHAHFAPGHQHHHRGPSDVADLAHRWGVPLSTVTEAAMLFSQYAVVPSYAEDTDMLRSGMLTMDALMNLVTKLAEKAHQDELSATPEEIMGIVDANQDGAVDFHEFTHWYHERAFLEYMNLTKAEIEVRRVGQQLGISVADMDFYKKQFDKFDTDHSGLISIDEFREIMHIMMKVTNGLRIPESRIHHFWQECDDNGSGTVDLAEFVTFYIKHFDADAEDASPMEDYYKSIRRVSSKGACL